MSGYWNGSSANGLGRIGRNWWTIRICSRRRPEEGEVFSVERDLINIYFKFKIE
jgi:hypothetical protein